MPVKFITYGDYVWLPIATVVCWLGMILGLLLWWVITDNGVMYSTDDATIVFISDVGAAHQWLFILGSVLTAVFYIATLLSERWLRHVDRIPGTVRSRERTLDILTIIFGTLGAISLVICSCFKDTTHATVHWICAALFVLLVAISCIFQTWEMFALKEDHPDRNHLRRNAIIKLVIVVIAVAVAASFGATYGVCHGDGGIGSTSRCNRITSAAAVCEWVIAFLLAFYFATFILDLWPAAKTSPRMIRRKEKKENASSTGEKGLLPPAAPFAASPSTPAAGSTASSVANVERPSDAERADYYSSHPEYYQQNPAPVHNSAGVAYEAPQHYAPPTNAYGTSEFSPPASAPTSKGAFATAPVEEAAPTYHGQLTSERL